MKSIDRFGWLKRVALAAFLAMGVAVVHGWSQSKRQAAIYAQSASLGHRLFKDVRFSTTKGDLPASCSHCHLFDEDPQGVRAHTDFLSRSWVSYRDGDPRREELRNSPTLFDVTKMPRLHFDGEFASLEDLVKGTLAGRPMGWLPNEKVEAFERIYRVVLNDGGEGGKPGSSYREQFKSTYGVNIQNLQRDEVIDLIARAISDYMRTLNSEMASPYDRFIAINALDGQPVQGEDAKTFAGRLLARVTALENEGRLKLTKSFDSNALAGMKIFFRVEGPGAVGDCAACHTPPLFTDFSFHNMGISQIEYDKFHGEGSFAALRIPNASEAARPVIHLREAPSIRKPGDVDLGHWNFVDMKSSLRRADESDDLFLKRMIATFKTPTLRHLKFTPPYMHNGAFATLDDAIAEIMQLSNMARAGTVREADDELAKIRISESDIPPLIAFLNTLNQDLRQKKTQASKLNRK